MENNSPDQLLDNQPIDNQQFEYLNEINNYSPQQQINMKRNLFVLHQKKSRPGKLMESKHGEILPDDRFQLPSIRTLSSPDLDASSVDHSIRGHTPEPIPTAPTLLVESKRPSSSRSVKRRKSRSRSRKELKLDANELTQKADEVLQKQESREAKQMSRLKPPELSLHKISDQFKTQDGHLTSSPAENSQLKSPGWSIASGSTLAPFPSPYFSASSSSIGVDSSRPSSSISFIVRERLHSLTRDLNRRTRKLKEEIKEPPTPEDSMSTISQGEESSIALDKRSLGSFVKEFATTPISAVSDLPFTFGQPLGLIKKLLQRAKRIHIIPAYFDHQSKRYLAWLAVVSICFMYNAYSVPLRASYPYQTKDNLMYWLIFDYICDFVYFMDMIIFKPRLKFVRAGLTIKEKKDMRVHYLRSWTFKFDLLSLLPLDVFYLVPSVNFSPLLRLPRLLKLNSYRDFFYCVDSKVDNPWALRVVKTLTYLIYLIHCNSCVFYSISYYEGFGRNAWVYSGKGTAYIRCFYFAFKIGVGIGNNESPTNVYEHLFMTFSWFMGVFVFALLLGQIRDIVANASKNKEQFRKAMDSALQHCKALKISQPVQEKVRLWFIHTWDEQKTLNENQLIEKLPRKMQTDLAISVHYHVLSKVKLFQDCDRALLRDLVLKLQPVLFLPGDFVCRKGEVGKEMYIVNKGMVQVIGGPRNEVLVTLKEGSVFGEIALLAMSGSGGNRRTADVRSRGFSMLFILRKDDLHETIKDYPDAQRILKRKAKKLLAESKTRQQETQSDKSTKLEEACKVQSSLSTPKLLETVLQVIDPNTETAKSLQKALTPKHNARQKSKDMFSDMSSFASDENVNDDDCDVNNYCNDVTTSAARFTDPDDDEKIIVIRTETDM